MSAPRFPAGGVGTDSRRLHHFNGAKRLSRLVSRWIEHLRVLSGRPTGVPPDSEFVARMARERNAFAVNLEVVERDLSAARKAIEGYEAQLASTEELLQRHRAIGQMLIAEIGAAGPESAVRTAERAAMKLRERREAIRLFKLEEAETRRDLDAIHAMAIEHVDCDAQDIETTVGAVENAINTLVARAAAPTGVPPDEIPPGMLVLNAARCRQEAAKWQSVADELRPYPDAEIVRAWHTADESADAWCEAATRLARAAAPTAETAGISVGHLAQALWDEMAGFREFSAALAMLETGGRSDLWHRWVDAVRDATRAAAPTTEEIEPLVRDAVDRAISDADDTIERLDRAAAPTDTEGES